METPTIKRVKSKDGHYVWEVTYNCQTKSHHQSWQAMVFYHQAMECYRNDVGNLKALLHASDSNIHD